MATLTAADKLAKQKAVVTRATAFVGVQENAGHTNHGAQVIDWLTRAGASPGDPWCMAFAYCIFVDAGYTSANGVTLMIRTASCQAQADHARAAGLLVSADAARTRLKAGWVMLQWDSQLGRYAHTGIVRSYDPATGIFRSVEGNTNQDGSREGYEVAIQTRDIRDVRPGGHPRYAFIQTN